ncbi:hypothetical protein EDD16DRAFT_1524304 [Pisolithus croceorrhizus]|nr:hypothetical protein EDD16DRAFT_1524304 [Pisolithus croceorrhizus]
MIVLLNQSLELLGILVGRSLEDLVITGIGSMDAKFTSVQVPQLKSDLGGGVFDITAIVVGDAVLGCSPGSHVIKSLNILNLTIPPDKKKVTFKCPIVLFVKSHVTVSWVAWGCTKPPEPVSRAEQTPVQTRLEKPLY